MSTADIPHRSLRWAASDAAVLVGRSTRHSLRNVESLLMAIVLPVMLLLIFVYVFGGAIDTGTEYLNYVVPGIILVTAGFGASGTAVTVAQDMTEGIIDRFRSLPIRGWTVVMGHVVASVLRNLVATALVIGVAVVMGFRPVADPVAWLAVLGVVTLYILMITWVSVTFGLIATTPDVASGFTFLFLFLPYVSSAFVPTDTMPAALRWFAEHQPVTPVIDTVRGLLLGTPIDDSAWLAVAWCVGILLVVAPASARLFRRRTAV